MTQGNANILDMLLGPVTPQMPTGQAFQTGSVPGDGPMFGDLLSLFLGGSGDTAVHTGLNVLDAGQTFSRIVASDNASHGKQSGAGGPATEGLLNNSLSSAAMTMPVIGGSPSVTDTSISGQPLTGSVVSDDLETAAKNAEAPQFEGPWLSAAASRFVQTLIQSGAGDVGRSVPLADGRYEIVAAKIADNTARLTLRSPQKPSQVVQLSLPAEMLDDLAAPVTQKNTADGKSVTQRINILDYSPSTPGSDKNGPVIDHLFAKLQLRELKVESVTDDRLELSREAGTSSDGKAMVRLSARRAGQDIVTQRIMPREQLLVRAERSPMSDDSDTEASFQQILKSGSAVQKSVPINKFHALAGESGRTFNWFRPLELKDTAHLQDEDGDVTRKVLLGGNQTGQSEISSGMISRQGVQVTRFILPNNIAHTLKPNGQSVRIAIEPDSIGPARLHLVMRDTGLTARVTVDTIAAKTMIENSLSQLARQLHDAGVKVDTIQVNVAGGQADPRNFEQNFAQHHHVRISRYRDGEPAVEPAGAAAPILATARMEYAGPHGVNIYA